jgi:hypothetical protein
MILVCQKIEENQGSLFLLTLTRIWSYVTKKIYFDKKSLKLILIQQCFKMYLFEGQKKSFIMKKSILLYAIIINLAGTQCMSMAGGIRSLFSRYTPTGSTVLQTVKKASIALANKTCNHKTLTALSLVSAAIVTPQVRRAVSGGINSALNTVFFITAGIGPRSIVEIFLKAGVNVNQQHNRGWTALHNAVVGGNRAVVELLLAHKANPNINANSINRNILK